MLRIIPLLVAFAIGLQAFVSVPVKLWQWKNHTNLQFSKSNPAGKSLIINLASLKDKARWVGVDEFILHGQRYDVLKKWSTENGSQLLCVQDDFEAELLAALQDFFDAFSTNKGDTKSKPVELLKDWIAELFYPVYYPTCGLLSRFDLYGHFPSQFFSDFETPPPECLNWLSI